MLDRSLPNSHMRSQRRDGPTTLTRRLIGQSILLRLLASDLSGLFDDGGDGGVRDIDGVAAGILVMWAIRWPPISMVCITTWTPPTRKWVHELPCSIMDIGFMSLEFDQAYEIQRRLYID